jgi:hypothetical protein
VKKRILSIFSFLWQVVRHCLLSLLPLLISVIWNFICVITFNVFRHRFDYPWGKQNYWGEASRYEDAIYNSTQLVYVAVLFIGSIAIYRWLFRRMGWISLKGNEIKGVWLKDFYAACKFQLFYSSNKLIYWSRCIASSLSWLAFMSLSLGISLFSCCPNIMRSKMLSDYWWLTFPEYLIITLMGEVYLLRMVLHRS